MNAPVSYPGTDFTWDATLRAWWVDCLTCGQPLGVESSLIAAARLATLHRETEHGPRTFAGAPLAVDRAETEPCEAGTPGCCVRHLGLRPFACECW